MSRKIIVKRIVHRIFESMRSLRRTAVSRGILPSTQDYCRFVIISKIRSGSTMLSNALNSHPNAVCFFELFHRHSKEVSFEVQGYRSLKRNKNVLQLRAHNPPKFLSKFVWCRHSKRIGAVGFKLFYTQARTEKQPWWEGPPFDVWWQENGFPPKYGSRDHSLWNYLESDKTIRIIHLTRENELASIVSAATAKATGAWGDGASGGFVSSDGHKARISVEELSLSLEGSARFRTEVRDRFAGHNLLEVSYEELTGRNQRESFGLVFKFLGLPDVMPEIQTRKLRNQSLRESIENWDEVEKVLRDSHYSDRLEKWTS